MTKRPFRPRLRGQADVHTMWRTLISPLGWRCPRLYVILVDADDRPLPLVHEIDELPDRMPAAEAVGALAVFKSVLEEVEPGGRVAILYCRPGAGGLTLGDRVVCRRLYAAAGVHDLALEVIHVATDTEILPAPLDDLMVA